MSALAAGPRIDGRTLPLGLTRYTPDRPGRVGTFKKLHAPGNRLITASQVPALWNQSRFAGRYATVAHALGIVPLEVKDNSRIQIGRWLEPVAAAMLAEETGLRVKPIRAYARHRSIDGLLASPDTLAWDPQRDPLDAGNCELKVVHEFVFNDRWLDGPPLETQLQHQTQFACCGATWGYIGALVWGIGRFELVAYPTVPNPAAIKLIEDDVRVVLDLIARGELPDPDPHPTSITALQTAFPGVIPNKSVTLEGDEAVEGEKLFDEWVAVRAAESAAKARSKKIKNWFAMMAVDADELRVSADKYVRIKEVSKRESVTRAHTYRSYDLQNRATSDAPQQVEQEDA